MAFDSVSRPVQMSSRTSRLNIRQKQSDSICVTRHYLVLKVITPQNHLLTLGSRMGHTNLQSHLGYKTSNKKAHFWACFASFLFAFLQSLWNYCSPDFALSWQGKWSLLWLLLVLRGTVFKHLFAGTAVSLWRAVIIPSVSSLTWN